MRLRLEIELGNGYDQEDYREFASDLTRMIHRFAMVEEVIEQHLYEPEPPKKKYEIHFNEKFCIGVEADSEDEAYELAKAKKGQVCYYETEFVHADRLDSKGDLI